MRVRLTSGAYIARSIVASAQRQVNLFSEIGPPGAILDIGEQQPARMETLYPTPGLRSLGSPPAAAAARGLYRANNGTLFYVCGPSLYTVAADWTMTFIGTIADRPNIVCMADNGTTMVLVDGTSKGYQVDLATNAFSEITEATNGPTVPGTFEYAFSGSDFVRALDGYLTFNTPGTREFFITQNNNVLFDSLNVGTKNGYSDNLVAAFPHQRSLWLIGERTTEIWFNSGAANFPFEIIPGPFAQHGCIAKYSVAQIEESLFWLSQDQTGTNVAVRTANYNVERISTHAIETEWSTYSTIADAEGFCFQQGGHQFWQVNFPTADKSWRYDGATGEWHEAVWSDANGEEHRHRARVMAYANETIMVGDWQTGELYALDPQVYTDDGAPIVHIRGFPHIVGDGDRVFYQNLILDMQVGDYLGNDDPLVILRWSDDRGRTFGNPITSTMGRTGKYLTSIQFNRLGMARDRVWEASWSAAANTALQGAFVTFTKGSS